ncbi:MAG: HEAT repeat domain-containing protein [Desulfitobacteriaceae bacterium]
MEVLEFKQPIWTEEEKKHLNQSLAAVFLEEWGGPRSPLALQYIHGTIIPDLLHCFQYNEDLLQNQTFAEIVSWKLKTQFAYPASAAGSLAADLLRTAQGISTLPQVTDTKEPWRRIFRLWVSDESLPNIAERTGYPLDYLDLLLLRLKKLRGFMSGRRVSLLECLQNGDLKDYGFEQLSFLYQFQFAISGEPLYRERLVLEQVIYDLGLPLEVSDLVTILEIVHAHEGKLDEPSLIDVLREVTVPAGTIGGGKAHLFAETLKGLISLYWVQKSKAGKLSLSEKGAQTMAGFLLPRLAERISEALAVKDLARAKEILLEQNPEILVRLMDQIVKGVGPEESMKLLSTIFKLVDRRVDLHVLRTLGKVGPALDFLLNVLTEKDSQVRAKACEALGNLGNQAAIPKLRQMLTDDVPGVREMAAQALGKLEAREAADELERIAGDYAEAVAVREKAKEALRRLKGLV